MTRDEETRLLAQVDWLVRTVQATGFGGPLFLPGNGSGQPADPPKPPDPPPPPPPPPPVSGNVDETWDWALMGEDHRQVFAANRLYTFAIAVPNGYAGTLELKAGEVPGSPRFEPSMSLWISETPGGAPVPRTLALINRPWSTGGPQTVTHPNPAGGRTYYLNFKVSQGGAYLLRINHQ